MTLSVSCIGHRNKIPPLDKFMIQRFEQTAETTPITSAGSSTQSAEETSSSGPTLHEEVTPSHISTRSHSSLLSPQGQITRHANEHEADGKCAYGGVICWIVILTCVFLLLVIIMMGIILRDYHRDYDMKRKMGQWDDYQSNSRPQQYLTESWVPTPPPPYTRRDSPDEKKPSCHLQGVETVV